jgi:hypothetical protein
MRRGDRAVSNSLASNAGAVFSECGYATLVGRAERDESLIEKLGLRLDMPPNLLRELLAMSTDVVRARFLMASRPVTKEKEPARAAMKASPKESDLAKALNRVIAVNRAGRLNGSIVGRFAVSGEYTKVLAALSFMAEIKIEATGPLIESDRLYALIVACKAARLEWSTTTMIIRNRPGCRPITQFELAQGREVFDGTPLPMAQWTVRFASDRCTLL